MAVRGKSTNKLIKDDSGYCTGKLIEILEIEERTINPGKKNETTYAEQFEFIFEVNATKKPIKLRLWTSQKINPEKFVWEKDSEPNWTKLTQLALNCKLISIEQLSDDKSIEKIDFSLLIGKDFKFKTIPSKNAKSLSTIDISSINLI